MGHSSNSRLALLWLVSAFGAVAVARHEAHSHPPAAAAVSEPVQPRPAHQAEALRDGQQLDINAASASELELLPGVGPSLAGRLVEARDRLGRYLSAEDLLKVKGVGRKTLEKLRPYLKFDLKQLEHTAKSELTLSERNDVSALPQDTGADIDTERPLARSQVVDPKPEMSGRPQPEP